MNDDYHFIAPLIKAAHEEKDFEFATADKEEIKEYKVKKENLDDFIKENLLQNTTEKQLLEKLKDAATNRTGEGATLEK